MFAALLLAVSVVPGLARADAVEVVPRDPEDEIEVFRDGAGV